ncbi:MAG: hypothetical protein KatS3mg103_0002 [Phycisphaerales bacterium]|nr:MAG: hypothetical protein KatS3mg103_0002 [Phycisphaerales bacterium]
MAQRLGLAALVLVGAAAAVAPGPLLRAAPAVLGDRWAWPSWDRPQAEPAALAWAVAWQPSLSAEDVETLRQKAEAQLAGAQGAQAMVRLVFRTGQILDGELVEETPQSVTLRIAGIERRFNQPQIERLIRLPDLATRYRQWRRAIPDGDVGQIEQLVQWLVSQELYHVAHYEAARLHERRPRDPRVGDLLRQMAGLAELYEQRGQGVARDRPDRPDPLPLLGPEQVNLIRVYEIDLLDPPRMRIDPRDVEAFLLAYKDDPRVPQTPEGRQAMIAGDPLDVVRLMFQLRAREFYPTVRVLEDPPAMRRFRREVAGWLAVGCATTRCHGGAQAGGLRLVAENPRGQAQAYTNFLILTRARLPDGTPLINVDEPDKSPLLHLGLRREGSLYPHPPVPTEDGRGDAWREVFARTGDARWRATTEWIRSLYRPRPRYPIEYPPGERDGPPPAGSQGQVQEPADDARRPEPDQPDPPARPDPTGPEPDPGSAGPR